MKRLSLLLLVIVFFAMTLTGCQQYDTSSSSSSGDAASAVATVADPDISQLVTYSFPDTFNLDEATLSGNLFYLDPVNGSMEGDGSQASPWTSLQAVIEAGYVYGTDSYTRVFNESAPVHPGDTLVLLSGYHGSVELNSYVNEDFINVVVPEGEDAVVGRLKVSESSHWRFKGLTIMADQDDEYPASFHMLRIEADSSYITIDNFSIMTTEDVSGWSAADWSASASLGVKIINSSYIVVRDSDISNVSGGIYVDADLVIVQGNSMKNVSGDGMHGHGDDLYFVNNSLINRYDVDGSSADGFQSWASGTSGSARQRVYLSGNMIISNADSNNPFPGQFTGINCNDGPYAEWVIENNVIISDDTEGIILYGASDSSVVNNTVLSTSDNVLATIAIFEGKDESAVSNSTVRNNITNSILADEGVSIDHNLLLTSSADYDAHFVDFDGFDVSLFSGSSAIDSGAETGAPGYDILGNARPQGNGIDLGAYEVVQ